MCTRLISPDWKVYVVEKVYVVAEVGADRSCRKVAAGWLPLHLIKWVKHVDRHTTVPIVGSTVAEKLALMSAYDPGINGSELKKLLNGKRTSPVNGWELTNMPTEVLSLHNGESLLTSIEVS